MAGFDGELIAPCGMNCGVCVHYLAGKTDLNRKGFAKAYCPGCRARGKNCLYMGDRCEAVGKGLVRFCFECGCFPCERLKALDKRYRGKYHLSMIENLLAIREQGMDRLLAGEAKKWRCPNCGETICCHNGLCLSCQADVLLENKKYRWGER